MAGTGHKATPPACCSVTPVDGSLEPFYKGSCGTEPSLLRGMEQWTRLCKPLLSRNIPQQDHTGEKHQHFLAENHQPSCSHPFSFMLFEGIFSLLDFPLAHLGCDEQQELCSSALQAQYMVSCFSTSSCLRQHSSFPHGS